MVGTEEDDVLLKRRPLILLQRRCLPLHPLQKQRTNGGSLLSHTKKNPALCFGASDGEKEVMVALTMLVNARSFEKAKRDEN